MDDNEKQCCGNCKYAAYIRENDGYVCENMDSYYVSDYVEYDHRCEEWRNRDD